MVRIFKNITYMVKLLSKVNLIGDCTIIHCENTMVHTQCTMDMQQINYKIYFAVYSFRMNYLQFWNCMIIINKSIDLQRSKVHYHMDPLYQHQQHPYICVWITSSSISCPSNNIIIVLLRLSKHIKL